MRSIAGNSRDGQRVLRRGYPQRVGPPVLPPTSRQRDSGRNSDRARPLCTRGRCNGETPSFARQLRRNSQASGHGSRRGRSLRFFVHGGDARFVRALRKSSARPPMRPRWVPLRIERSCRGRKPPPGTQRPSRRARAHTGSGESVSCPYSPDAHQPGSFPITLRHEASRHTHF